MGKSFAYLIPSLLTNQMSQKPVIIATSSIQLSEQIHKDLRIIGSRLGFSTVRSVVGKGMGQYACQVEQRNGSVLMMLTPPCLPLRSAY
ncbi:hypothetical protein Q0F98_37235 [Paenibacillus amylolyticus]|nr:hypothetical protein Q0F98_37235 [Paenibacillus amylolyticus]